MARRRERQPNLFELDGQYLHVTYSTTGIDGQPHLSYHDNRLSLSFRGEQISTTGTEIGTVVTVTLFSTPDAGSTSFSLLVPRVNLDSSGHAAIRTVGITTLHRTSIAPQFLFGQLERYTVVSLQGTASQVDF
jgi:hypothetical protein